MRVMFVAKKITEDYVALCTYTRCLVIGKFMETESKTEVTRG